MPKSYAEYIQVMFDMMLLSFQTDSTRVATFLLANEGSNKSFEEIGIAEGHAVLAHIGCKGSVVYTAIGRVIRMSGLPCAIPSDCLRPLSSIGVRISASTIGAVG